jgi:hypothetical protein
MQIGIGNIIDYKGRYARPAKHKQWTKQPSNGGGRDAKGRLFVLYSATQGRGWQGILRSEGSPQARRIRDMGDLCSKREYTRIYSNWRQPQSR